MGNWGQWLFLVRRLAALVPQLLAVSVFTFVLMRMLPGNPADVILGPARTEAGIAALTREMGLDRPIYEQYWIYLTNVLKGDLGTSWFSGEPVLEELLRRAPATLELVTFSLIVAVAVGITIGTVTALRTRGVLTRVFDWYIRIAGSLPDFWIGLIAVYVFYFTLGLAPAPMGRLGIVAATPPAFIGFVTVDSLLAGQFKTFVEALRHLSLPVLTLGLILAPMVGKVTRATMLEVLSTDFIHYARAAGLKRRTVIWYAVGNALPPVITLIGILFAYLLGGTVLMESVFSWGGVGQYAVQAVVNADFLAVQGFVLVAATFTMLVYLVVDFLHMAVDPRVSHY